MPLAPGNPSSYNLAPGESNSAGDMRRKLALMLAQQGMESDPIKSPWQGVGRVANAMMGNFEIGLQDAKDENEKKSARDAIATFIGGGPPQTMPAPAATTAPIAPPVLPTPDVQPSIAPTVPEGTPMSSNNAPRGFRNLNPLNIKDGAFAQSQPGYVGTDGTFAKFDKMDSGSAAAGKLLDSYGKRGINTPAAIINRWAPPSDNNPTSAYAAKVASAIGVDPNAPINVSDPGVRQKIIAAMAQFENGKPLPAAAPAQVASLDPSAGVSQPTPQVSPGVAKVAQAMTPQSDAPILGQSPNAMRGGFAPDRKAALLPLLNNKYAAPFAQQMLLKEMEKEQGRTRPLVDPRERAAAGIPQTDNSAYQVDSLGKISAVNNQPNIALNATNTGESAYSKGKAEDALGLERSSDKTLQERQQLDVFKSLVQDFKTGKLAPAQSTAGAWGDAMGLDPKTMEKLGIPPNAAINGQLIESLSNQLTLGMIGTKGGEGGAMPANNFSDADRKFLQNTVPGLARMQGGNLILAEIKQRGLDRHLDKIAMWDEYRTDGKKYEDFERDWRKKVRSEPSLFADIPDMVRSLSAQPAAAGAPAPAAAGAVPLSGTTKNGVPWSVK